MKNTKLNGKLGKLRQYVEKRLAEYNVFSTPKLKIDMTIRLSDYQTMISKTKFGCIIFQMNPKREISETQLTIYEMAKLYDLIHFKPLDIDLT